METQLRTNVSSHYILMDLETIYQKVKNNSLCLTPTYQRGSVWTPAKRVGLIESIIFGYPIPSLMLSQKSLDEFNVMDGKQRIETIAAFKDNEFPVSLEGIRKCYKDMDERRKARFDAHVFSVSISRNLNEAEESFIYERINRAMPLSGGEKILSYYDKPFAKSRDEIFSADNPLNRELTDMFGVDCEGRTKRNEKISNLSGYIGGCGCGVSYITTSVLRLQPLLDMDEATWSQYKPVVEANMERFVDIWRKVSIEDGTVIHPDWKAGSRIWRLGFLNGYILYSLVSEDSDEMVASVWRKFIRDASVNAGLLVNWKQSFNNGNMSLNKRKLQSGWCQVKYYYQHNAFDTNFVREEGENTGEEAEVGEETVVEDAGQIEGTEQGIVAEAVEILEEMPKNKRKRYTPKRRT